MLEVVGSVGVCDLPQDVVVRVGNGEHEAGIFRLCDLGRSVT